LWKGNLAIHLAQASLPSVGGGSFANVHDHFTGFIQGRFIDEHGWCLLHSRLLACHFLFFAMGDDSGEKEVTTSQEVTGWCKEESTVPLVVSCITGKDIQFKAPNDTVWAEEATQNGPFRVDEASVVGCWFVVPNGTNGLDELMLRRIADSNNGTTTCFVGQEERDTNGEERLFLLEDIFKCGRKFQMTLSGLFVTAL
jgi:hypothetical protein